MDVNKQTKRRASRSACKNETVEQRYANKPAMVKVIKHFEQNRGIPDKNAELPQVGLNLNKSPTPSLKSGTTMSKKRTFSISSNASNQQKLLLNKKYLLKCTPKYSYADVNKQRTKSPTDTNPSVDSMNNSLLNFDNRMDNITTFMSERKSNPFVINDPANKPTKEYEAQSNTIRTDVNDVKLKVEPLTGRVSVVRNQNFSSLPETYINHLKDEIKVFRSNTEDLPEKQPVQDIKTEITKYKNSLRNDSDNDRLCNVLQPDAFFSKLENRLVPEKLEKSNEDVGKILELVYKNDKIDIPKTDVADNKERWNTTYYMLKRLLQIKDAINLYTSNRNTISMISAQDWFDLEKIVAILKPFEEVTKEMSSSQACISSVIPLIYTLKSTLNNTISTNNDESEYIKMFIRKLFDDINLRFADTENDMFYVLATYLDPRYKAKFFSDVTKEKIQEHLLLAVSQCADSDNVEVVPSKKIRLSNENVGEYSKKINNIQEHLYDLLESDDDDGEIGQKCADFDEYIKSLSDYSNEKRIKIQENPLNWWKTNAHKYKCMLSIVRQYLSCPAGSVPNEQLFSGAGLIYDPLRNGLDSDKAAKFFLMKYNLPITNDY